MYNGHLYFSRTTTAHWRRYTSMGPKREYLNIYGLADEITGYIDRFNFRLDIRERSEERSSKSVFSRRWVPLQEPVRDVAAPILQTYTRDAPTPTSPLSVLNAQPLPNTRGRCPK